HAPVRADGRVHAGGSAVEVALESERELRGTLVGAGAPDQLREGAGEGDSYGGAAAETRAERELGVDHRAKTRRRSDALRHLQGRLEQLGRGRDSRRGTQGDASVPGFRDLDADPAPQRRPERRMSVHDGVLAEQQDLSGRRGARDHGGGSSWAIHPRSGSSTTGRDERRPWTSRAPTSRQAARSASTAPRSSVLAASAPPRCWARTIGSAKPARSAPSASARAASRPPRTPPEAITWTRGPLRLPSTSTAAPTQAAVGMPQSLRSCPSPRAASVCARSCSTRVQLVPPAPETSMTRTPRSRSSLTTSGPI